jgi:hypothetical protein
MTAVRRVPAIALARSETTRTRSRCSQQLAAGTGNRPPLPGIAPLAAPHVGSHAPPMTGIGKDPKPAAANIQPITPGAIPLPGFGDWHGPRT